MERIYIGIDPGKNGGIAVIDEDLVRVVPYSDEELNRKMLEVVMSKRSVAGTVCCLEAVHAMHKQGVTSMFNFGKAYGYIKGVLEAFCIPYQEITPQKWKKEFGLTSDKTASVEVCRRLFPDVNLLATPRCKKAHDGMAEALLMAEYARRKL